MTDVAEAVREVVCRHPLPGYVEELADELHAIGNELFRTCPPPGRLLDVGCGGLDKTALFSLLGYECCACDDFTDPWHRRNGNLSALERFAASLGIDLRVQDDARPLPWEEGSFDIVTLLAVIEHLHSSPRDVLNLAGRQLKPGGHVVVVTPNAVNLRKRLAVLAGRSNLPDVSGFYHALGEWRGHVREYTLAEVRLVLQWTGFEVVRAGTFHGMLRRRIRSAVARAAFRTVTAVVPTLRDTILVVGRRPAAWQPAAPDENAYRRSIAPYVPQAIR